MTTYDLFSDPPLPIATRFELVARRLAESWLRARRLDVSSDDLRAACEFLARDGTTVEDLLGGLVRLRPRDGEIRELSREDAMLLAFRRLAEAQAHGRDAGRPRRPDPFDP